jgi:hypothetical protein
MSVAASVDDGHVLRPILSTRHHLFGIELEQEGGLLDASRRIGQVLCSAPSGRVRQPTPATPFPFTLLEMNDPLSPSGGRRAATWSCNCER